MLYIELMTSKKDYREKYKHSSMLGFLLSALEIYILSRNLKRKSKSLPFSDVIFNIYILKASAYRPLALVNAMSFHILN